MPKDLLKIFKDELGSAVEGILVSRLMEKADGIWVFGEATEGMASEIAFAAEHGIEVRFMEPEGMEGGNGHGDGAGFDAFDGE